MDWTRFNTHGNAPAASIETLLSLPFERGCRARYDKGLADVYLLDGSGGDGGVETFAELTSGEEIGIQASGFGIDSAMAKRATSRNRSVRRDVLRVIQRSWDRMSRPLAVIGRPGTGKTQAALAVADRRCRSGLPAVALAGIDTDPTQDWGTVLRKRLDFPD